MSHFKTLYQFHWTWELIMYVFFEKWNPCLSQKKMNMSNLIDLQKNLTFLYTYKWGFQILVFTEKEWKGLFDLKFLPLFLLESDIFQPIWLKFSPASKLFILIRKIFSKWPISSPFHAYSSKCKFAISQSFLNRFGWIFFWWPSWA